MKKNCAHCGKEFEARRSNVKYCKPGCNTMACNKRKGFKTGRIRVEGIRKDLVAENPPGTTLHGMQGTETGRASNVVTGAGTLESIFGSSVANIITHLITQGEYDERIAKLQRALNYIIHLLETLVGVQEPKQQENKGMAILKTNQPMTGMQKIDFPDQPLM